MNSAEFNSTAEVPYIPAPWELRGSSYILVYRFPAWFAERVACHVPELEGRFAGGLGAVIVVDYHATDVGPYRELLLIPGQFHRQGRHYYSVTQIDVTTEISLVNGRRNWGLPKRLVRAGIEPAGGRRERFRFSRDGAPYAGFTFRPLPVKLPATTAVLPTRLRTLMQPREGRLYFFAPSAVGRLAPAIVEKAWVNGDKFPDFTSGRLLVAFKLENFRLHFPQAFIVASVTPGPGVSGQGDRSS